MSFYNQRPYGGVGPVIKKPRMGVPRGPPQMNHAEENSRRLMSFKEFILSQSNDINEQDALAKYSEYKIEFTRRMIDKFFKDHKEEEWFRNKYRPIELTKFEEANRANTTKRREIYQQLIDKRGEIDFPLDSQHIDSVSQLLDDFSLMLEGATLEDLEDPEKRRNFAVSSIYIPEIHPSVDKAMIEEYASTHPGFLRIAMSEAKPDKGFMRRVWITYKQMDQESLRKLCWEYNAHKFNGQETKAIVNKEMNNRVRFAQFWFCHSQSAKADLKNVARLLMQFEGEDCQLLEAIKDHLIEETNEEEQVLGVNDQNTVGFEFTQNVELLKALDRFVLYLRIVHSYDYYASTKYVGEDDMPHKVGIMFVRPIPPSTFDAHSQSILHEFIAAQKTRIDSFLERPTLSEIEQKQLGKRNSDEEVENFIYQHTYEKKAGEKYVCKITRKKFTAPEFVRKHIFNRCEDKIEEVRTDVEYFNNYVADPKRPM